MTINCEIFCQDVYLFKFALSYVCLHFTFYHADRNSRNFRVLIDVFDNMKRNRLVDFLGSKNEGCSVRIPKLLYNYCRKVLDKTYKFSSEVLRADFISILRCSFDVLFFYLRQVGNLAGKNKLLYFCSVIHLPISQLIISLFYSPELNQSISLICIKFRGSQIAKYLVGKLQDDPFFKQENGNFSLE